LKETLNHRQLPRADLEEESSWIQERLAVLEAQTSPDSLATAQSLLSKHETFETDLGVHRDRFADVRTTGQSLIDEVSVLNCLSGPTLAIALHSSHRWRVFAEHC